MPSSALRALRRMATFWLGAGAPIQNSMARIHILSVAAISVFQEYATYYMAYKICRSLCRRWQQEHRVLSKRRMMHLENAAHSPRGIGNPRESWGPGSHGRFGNYSLGM
jgi:hypothetical protein